MMSIGMIESRGAVKYCNIFFALWQCMRYEITFPYENLGWWLAQPWAVGQFMLNDNIHYENFNAGHWLAFLWGNLLDKNNLNIDIDIEDPKIAIFCK